MCQQVTIFASRLMTQKQRYKQHHNYYSFAMKVQKDKFCNRFRNKEATNLILPYTVSICLCKAFSLIPLTFKELNKASSCTYTKCLLKIVLGGQKEKKSWTREENNNINNIRGKLCARYLKSGYLLFGTIVAPSFAIITLHKQSALPKKEPKSIVKAIFAKGHSPNVMFLHLSLQMFLLHLQSFRVIKNPDSTTVNQ